MSFSEQLGAASAAVKTSAQIENLSRELWAAYAAGLIGDDDAQAATELLHARRRSLMGSPIREVRKAFSAPPRRRPAPRSPDREASIRRRRLQGSEGLLPPDIFAQFTEGERAVLSVIARDIQINGRCLWCVDKIAGIAGVSPRTVQRTQRRAEAMGRISIEARPHRGRKSDTNIIRIVCAEWAAWLRLHRVTSVSSHGKQKKNSILTQRRDAAAWRFDPAAEASLGSAMRGSRSLPPARAAIFKSGRGSE